MTKPSEIKKLSLENRKRIIDMVYFAGCGHPGGSLSMIDVLTAVYEIDVDFSKEKRTKVILSKGHAVPAQYAILNEKGFISDDEMKTFRMCDSRLEGHPHHLSVPEVDSTTGLLGQGLSLGVGTALAKKMNNDDTRVYVFVGDGELVEGQIWEAMIQASHYNLNNLIMILDYNKLSSSGPVCDCMNIEPVKDKFMSFGWKTFSIDGHNYDEIYDVINSAKLETLKPVTIISNTVKGKGVSFMENNPQWHSGGLNDCEYEQALKDLSMGVD